MLTTKHLELVTYASAFSSFVDARNLRRGRKPSRTVLPSCFKATCEATSKMD